MLVLGSSHDFQQLQYIAEKPWGSVGFARYSDCASSKDHGDVLCLVKTLDFGGENKK